MNADRYSVIADDAKNADNVDSARKLAMNILKTAVIRTHATVEDVFLKQEVSSVMKDAYEVAGWDEPHRAYMLGQTLGAERVLGAMANRHSTPITRLFREALIQAADTLQAKDKQTITDTLPYTLKIAEGLENIG